jgi:UDP-glucose 4-epimerase
MQGEPLTVFGDGEQTRAFSHIDDVAPHIARSVHVESAYGEVINIGADSVYSINDLIKVVGNTFGSVPSVVNLQARKEVSHAYSSHAKAASLLASRPTMSLDAGVQRMADWVRRVGIRSSKRFAGIEIEKKFPPSWSSSVEKAEEVPV